MTPSFPRAPQRAQRCRRVDAWLLSCLGLALSSCGGVEPPTPSYEGAEWLELDCIEEQRAPDSDELESLVDALVESYGGAETWRELSYIRLEDVYFKSSNDIMGNQGVREVFCRPDDCYRSIVEQRSGKEQRLLNRGEAWMSLMGYELKQTIGDNHVGIWWEWKTHRIPDLLSRPGVEVDGLAPVKLDGRWTVPLTVKDDERPDLTLYVDPSGPVVRRVEGEIPISAMVLGGGLVRSLAKDYSEFRRHDGILVAERTDVYDGEVRVLLVELRSFERATSIGDEVFSPTGPVPSLPR